MATGIKAKAAKIGDAAKSAVDGAAEALRKGAGQAGRAADDAAARTKASAQDLKGPSPNPATNLIIADIALRGGGQLVRRAIEHALLGMKYSPDRARDIIKGRSMAQTLVGTAIARVATRSVPGALLVGGGLLAKTLYDRGKQRSKAKAAGEAVVDKQRRKGTRS